MSDDLVIEASGLSKRFKLYNRPRDRFFEWITFGKRLRHDSFWALRDVNLHLKHGEKLGIIGPNGSGKSTLLKILAGSLTPTDGSLTITGRAFALIELSTGFNKDLTGRENISFVGMMLGLDRDYVEQRKERIVAFADIGSFIDRPVRFYSSGMFVRLAFSLFAFFEPDLLMIDEAFAVGDAEFKEKSYKLMQSMVRMEGRSVILVSHSMSTIESVSDRVMWIDGGECRMDGEPRQVIAAYREHLRERKEGRREREQVTAAAAGGAPTDVEEPREAKRPALAVPNSEEQLPIEQRQAGETGGAFVEAVWLEEKDGTLVQRVGAHRKFAIGCAVRFTEAGEPEFGVRIVGVDGAVITSGDTRQVDADVEPARAGETRAIRWPIARGLAPGMYDIVCWCGFGAAAPGEPQAHAMARLHVDGPPRVNAALNLVMRPMIGRAADDR